MPHNEIHVGPPASVPVEEDIIVRGMQESLRARAVRLRRYAALVLLLVILVLCAGITVFAAAGLLASRETNAVITEERSASLRLIRQRIDAVSQQISRLQEVIEHNLAQYKQEISGQGLSGSVGRGPLAESIALRLKDLERELRGAESEMRDLQAKEEELVARLEGGEIAPSPESQVSAMVSALSTRIGAVILLVFLVQILVPLYRYNLRLASHYDARADAIGIARFYSPLPDDEKLDRLIRAFSPDTIGFGAAPAAPTDQLLQIAKYLSGPTKL